MKSCFLLLLSGFSVWASSRELLPESSSDSAATRWMNKPVMLRRLLDDMNSLGAWTVFTTDAPEVVDARKAQKVTEAAKIVASIELTEERVRERGKSLRLRMPTRLDVPGPKSGRGWGTAGVRRHFDREDWQDFNRISLWIFPDCPGVQVVALELRLYNEGKERLPALFGQEGETTMVLRNHEWNHVLWEIGNVARDKITSFEVSFLMSGNEPDAAHEMIYDFERLELEMVQPDYVEGWQVWPGRISYSHSGYQPGAKKSAIASDLTTGQFRLINQANGKVALSKPLQQITNRLGVFQVMDFSEVRESGSYTLEAENARTRPFRIDSQVWQPSILKALNFLYAERCGFEIPGVHGVCHRDWTVVHGDERIVINGGWHDAGDLTQGLGNTAEIVYGLFSLAGKIHSRDEDPELYQRLLEEAKWGLDWILKTSFGDGYRNQGSVSSRWTDGIIGSSDDIVSLARNTPMGHFTAAAAEAIAARVLHESEPPLAAHCLRMAEADWEFACAGLTATNMAEVKEQWRGSFDSGGVEHEVASVAVLSSMDLWQVTGKQRYADKAVELAQTIVESQERKRPDWDIPLLGFFYTSPAKARILHYCHRGREQGPTLALTRLCNAFPNHPDWMKWYSAVTLYSSYLKSISKYTEPYAVLPASIYRDDEYQSVPETRRESFRTQVLQGIDLGKGYHLRLFPVWMDYRGHFGTILPQAQALMSAAHLRGDLDLAALAQRQLEWIVGRNPFSQSAMYGEGYDFTPLYAPFPGHITGALPVGIQTRGDRDLPYWPVQSTWTYKEVWVHPVARWLWIMQDLDGPALVEGQAEGPVEFIPAVSNVRKVIRANSSNGKFRVFLPEGKYTVRCQKHEEPETFLPAGKYFLNLCHDRVLNYEITRAPSDAGEVRFKVSARGAGRHQFEIRTDNLVVTDPRKELALKHGSKSTLDWGGRIASPESPWVIVVVADGNLALRKELTGAVWER